MTTPDLDFDLGDATGSGVYFVSATTPVFDTITGAAGDRGMTVARVNLGACRNKSCVLAQFASSLAFPPDFGHNWDALADSLSDLSWLKTRGCVLLIEHTDGLREARVRDFNTMLDILDQAADAWAHAGIGFFAFVRMADAEA